MASSRNAHTLRRWETFFRDVSVSREKKRKLLEFRIITDTAYNVPHPHFVIMRERGMVTFENEIFILIKNIFFWDLNFGLKTK